MADQRRDIPTRTCGDGGVRGIAAGSKQGGAVARQGVDECVSGVRHAGSVLCFVVDAPMRVRQRCFAGEITHHRSPNPAGLRAVRTSTEGVNHALRAPMSRTAIGDHGLLSDCRSAGLVAAGSVDWLCFPRFDSEPVFARLLDDEAGHFAVRPSDPQASFRHRYRPQSLVLETTWATSTGELVVVDALALGKRERGHDLGRFAPGVLLRSARCTSGTVELTWEYAPRPEFGLIHPLLSRRDGGIVSHGGATILLLSTDADAEICESVATGTALLNAGDELCWALQQADAWEQALPDPWKARRIRKRLTGTEESWRSWSELHQSYEGPQSALVYQSGLVLQALSHAGTGAIVAAPTTSLPEGAGSGRTWDYRYTWVRDASMTMRGLWVAACPEEANRFFAFLARAASTQLERGVHLQIMFGVGGEHDLTEREVSHLSGWRSSGPVRSGNDAWRQSQLDVYGALLDAAFLVLDGPMELDAATSRLLVAAIEAAAAHWQDDDQGIWEIRAPARPYLHSKVMCWVALDRGIAMAARLGAGDRVTQWMAVREQIRDAILRDGWNADVGAFTQYFGSADLDATALLVAVVGLLPADDPRLSSTVDAIIDGLSDSRGLLYRYRGDDGLIGDEGSFLLCTFWLAQALAVIGRVSEAEEVLDRAAGYASVLGLFAEQVDPESGELLGNFPQAFSHLGLILAAQAIADARNGPGPLIPLQTGRLD